MCCIYDRLATQQYQQVADVDEDGYVIVYKVLSKRDVGLYGPFYPHSYIPGVNKSNRLTKEYNSYDDNVYYKERRISSGIHVFIDVKSAEKALKYDIMIADMIRGRKNKYVLVKVKARLVDLVCCGVNNDAVFMEVELSEEEYNKATA